MRIRREGRIGVGVLVMNSKSMQACFIMIFVCVNGDSMCTLGLRWTNLHAYVAIL